MPRPRKTDQPTSEPTSAATAVAEPREAVAEAPQPVQPPQAEPEPQSGQIEHYDVHLLYGVVRCCVVNDRVVSAGHRMDWMVGKHIHDLKTQVHGAGGTIRRVGVER